jgi:hypothetical protein
MATNGGLYQSESQTEKGLGLSPHKTSDEASISHVSAVEVGREHLSETLAPHESYEGKHRWDPSATWTEQEERRCVQKTDIMLLSWICVMVGSPRDSIYLGTHSGSSLVYNSIVAISQTL